jgi:hypothetical protein
LAAFLPALLFVPPPEILPATIKQINKCTKFEFFVQGPINHEMYENNVV